MFAVAVIVSVAVVASVAVIVAGIAPDCSFSADLVPRHDYVLRPSEKNCLQHRLRVFRLFLVLLPTASFRLRARSGLPGRVEAIRRYSFDQNLSSLATIPTKYMKISAKYH